jgi:DNA-directed RNA polymerase specialized sigma24 family protein
MQAPNELLTEYAQTLIRVKARQLVRRPGFSRSDQGSIENELFLRVLAKVKQYDPKRSSPNTFVDRIVNSAAAMLVREQNRHKRSPCGNVEVFSLEMKIEHSTGSSKPLWASISNADLQRRIGRASLSDAELYELVEGVASAIAGLPPELQQVCESLLERNRSETESELGLSRRRLDAAMARIREHFARAGFGKI